MSRYIKNKTGSTLSQLQTGLKNDWLNGQTIDALEFHRPHQIFNLNKLRPLISSAVIVFTEDAAGTIEDSMAHSLAHLDAASEASITHAFAEDTTFERVANKGVSNGYAELDGTGRIPAGQLPSGLGGGVTYKGTWDANANTPALTSGVGTDGFMYKVSVAGSTALDGESSWAVGDQVIFGSGSWDKIDNTESITSVFGRTGAITAQAGDYDKTDVGLANVDDTSDLDKPVSTDTQTELATKQSYSEKGQPLGYAGLDASGKIPAGNVVNDLDSIMENGSTANVSSNIDIQTAGTANYQSTGALSILGSSVSLTSGGSQISTFYEKVSNATLPNGCQLTHGTTLKISSSTALYDTEMTSDSLVRKAYVDSAITLANAGAAAGGTLGDIKSSMLTEGQMSTQSADWVLADGRNVSGSDYAILTGNTSVPNLKGQFLRGLDPSGTVDPDGATRTLGDTQADADQLVTGAFGDNFSGSFVGSSAIQTGAFQLTNWVGRYSQAIGGGAYSGANFDNSRVIRTANESRPKNVSVNYFIKIN